MKALRFTTGTSLLVLMFLALFVPTTYQASKALFLLLALTGVGLMSLYSRLVWSGETLMACFLFATFGLINSLHGEVNAAKGAVSVLPVMTVWPMLFAILSAMLNRPDAFRATAMTLSVTFMAILAYSFIFIGNLAGIVPDWLYFELEEGQVVAFHTGSVEYVLNSIASLLFLVPFWWHYLLISNLQIRARTIHWMVLIVGLVLCVLTGRRAVQLVVLISPFIIMLTEFAIGRGLGTGFRLFSGLFNLRGTVVVSIGVLSLVAVFLSMDLRLDLLVDDFVGGFDFEDASNTAASDRSDQFKSLTRGWVNGNVLFGEGNGSNAELLRSDDMPWSYELTYVYLLFSNGVIGVLFYCLWFAWGLVRVRNALIQRPDMVIYVAPMITGVFGLLIGAASNPYFGKFDYLWIVFIPHLLAGAVSHQDEGWSGRHVRAS